MSPTEPTGVPPGGSRMIENRRSFHQELEDIRQSVVRLAAMVTEMIPRGTLVLLSADMRAAQALIEADDAVDELALGIEEHCYNVLALQQPMAGDLRGIVTAIRMVSEIERSADLMVNVAKGARRMYGVSFEPRVRGLIEQMSEEATRLFRLAIDAYGEGNAGLAAALDDIDDRLDELHVDYIESVFESHHNGHLTVEWGVQLALIGRYYERIGDHAVNMGNRVQYMVTGWLPEHGGAARAQARSAAAKAAAEVDGLSAARDAQPDNPVTDGSAAGEQGDDDGRPGLRLAPSPETDGSP
jgi:phosphate transport system protein